MAKNSSCGMIKGPIWFAHLTSHPTMVSRTSSLVPTVPLVSTSKLQSSLPGPPSRIAWSSSVTFRVVIGAVAVEDPVERVELLVPVALVEPQPLVRAGQRSRIEPTDVPPTHHGAPDETCSLEDLQVLGGRGQRHLQRLGQLADGQLPIGQPAEHVPSRVVRERVEHRVQLPRSFNHMVNYRSIRAYCQPIGYILAAPRSSSHAENHELSTGQRTCFTS